MEKKFAEVLKFCWEALLYEYLRTVGCPLRDREHDPRHFVMRYWRRSMLDPSVKPGFVPYYAKREVRDERTSQQHVSVVLFQRGLMMSNLEMCLLWLVLTRVTPRHVRSKFQEWEVPLIFMFYEHHSRAVLLIMLCVALSRDHQIQHTAAFDAFSCVMPFTDISESPNSAYPPP